MEDTNYYFSVTTTTPNPDTTSEGLAGGLDRLAQFFIKPTFDPNMVDREVRAIDSEYRNGKTNDAWRNYQLLKQVSNPNHPFSNFGCGNHETLLSKGPDHLVQELHNFWDTYYQASNLRLTVVGSSSLDALQTTVQETFGNLPHSDRPPRRSNKLNPDTSKFFPREHAVYDPSQPAFGREQMGKMRYVIPLLESRLLRIKFATPPISDPILSKTKPHRVISHLLGHESPGSLHALLNELGYIQGLTSGTAIDSSDFSLFSLTLSLTPKGMKEVDQVLKYVFEWMALIRQTIETNPELMSKYHDELRQMGAVNFKFRENGDPTDFCSWSAERMFEDADFDPARLLVHASESEEYDDAISKAFLDRLRPENCMIQIVDSDLKVEDEDGGHWDTEPLYGAIYRETDITAEQIEEWKQTDSIDEQLHLPELNKYIPTDFSLRCDDNDAPTLSTEEMEKAKNESPTLLVKRDNLQMWHKMDRFWRVPKTSIHVSILTPSNYESPRSMTLSRIYQRVLRDDLNSYAYDGTLAGCSYGVTCAPSGYRITIKGYSEKLGQLLDTVTTRMLSLIQEMKEGPEAHPHLYEKFLKAKENLSRETKNYRLDSPYEIAAYNSRLCMEEYVWYLDNYINEMEGPYAEKNPLTLEECASVAESCLTGRIKVTALGIGNIDEKGAQNVVDVLDEHFLKPSRPLHDAEMPKFRSKKLPTRQEAVTIFGPDVEKEAFPIRYQELAYSPSEENNAVEATFQVGCDSELGYEGIGVLDLLSHMAYNSAYNQLRTKEQLGYIVSAYTRKTSGGAWGLTVVVQSSNSPPEKLQERIEAWILTFRKEIEEMSPNHIAMEASGVVSQLLEGNTKLGQEIAASWNEILSSQSHNNDRMTGPAFDRMERLADELILLDPNDADDGPGSSLSATTMAGNKRKTAQELKDALLELFDRHLMLDGPERRAMISRVYNQDNQEAYDAALKEPGVLSTYEEMRHLKDFLLSYPVAPYWRTLQVDQQ